MKQLAVLLVFLTFGGTTAAWAENSQIYVEASAKLASEGKEAVAEDRLDDALKLYEQAVVANPKNVGAYVGLGEVHGAMGNLGTSLKYFSVALDLEPTNLPALEAQSMAYLKHDEVDRAEEGLTKIRRICQGDGCDAANRLSRAIGDYLNENVRADKQ